MASTSKVVRMGVVGMGNIARQHIANIVEGRVANALLTATCSRGGSTDLVGVSHFNDYRDLVASGLCDAVLVATPTNSHLEIGRATLDANLHLMMEKPMGLSVKEGENLLSYCKPNSVAALMLNQRADPLFLRMKEIIESSVLGDLIRINWCMTNWFRPEIYFQVSDWRATWRGEGGGVLVNQCIHNLDILQWLCGMPKALRAHCQFGRFHDVEVEDDVTAYLEYENGATGVFVGSTGEAPGVNRFEVIGDAGSLVFDGTQLTLTQNTPSTKTFNRTTKQMFGMPETSTEVLAIDRKVNQHAVLMQNFVNAIREDEPLIAPLAEGLRSLSIANAMLLSTWQEQTIEFPIDAAEYQSHLQSKIDQSSLRVKADLEAEINMDSSYR
mgnify:CR=1 FL=1